MTLLLYAAAGGAVGSGARHLVNVAMLRWLGPGFPWATLTVNVLGCFLMGLLIEALALRFSGSLELRTLLATGVLGGFTTFSAFSLDVATLISHKVPLQAGLYVAGTVGLSILALYAGFAVGRAVLS